MVRATKIITPTNGVRTEMVAHAEQIRTLSSQLHLARRTVKTDYSTRCFDQRSRFCTPGDDVLEFIELYDGGTGNTALDGLVVVLLNGSDDQSYAPVFDLMVTQPTPMATL